MHPDDPGIMGLTLEIGRTAVAAADLGVLLQRVCATLPGTLGVPAAAIVLVDLPDTQLAGVTASGPDPARLGEMELRAGTGPVQGTIRSGRPMVTPDLTRIGPPELAAAAADTGLTCSVVVPLRVDGEPAGGLQLFGHPGRPVGEGHIDALAGLADVLSARLTDVCAVRRLTGTVARLTAEHEAALPVAHATGMLAERYRTDPEEAARFLDSLARKTGVPVPEAARVVLDRGDQTDLPTAALSPVRAAPDQAAQIPTPRSGGDERQARPRPHPAPTHRGPDPWFGQDRRGPGGPHPDHRVPEEWRESLGRRPLGAEAEPEPRRREPGQSAPRPGLAQPFPERPRGQPLPERPTSPRPTAEQRELGTPAPDRPGGRRRLRDPAPEDGVTPPGPRGQARHRRADIG